MISYNIHNKANYETQATRRGDGNSSLPDISVACQPLHNINDYSCVQYVDILGHKEWNE